MSRPSWPQLATSLCAAIVVAMAATPARPAYGATFANAAAIPIADGTGTPPYTRGLASPYPSAIVVSGLTGTVSRLTVTLKGITHPNPDDLDVMLVGPLGQNSVLLSDAGESFAVNNLTLTFDDAAPAKAPDLVGLAPPSYKPTDGFGGLGEETITEFPPPAPTKPGGADGSFPLSTFDNTDPNGTWKLYVTDDRPSATGSIAAGWSLDVTTRAVSPPPLAPQLGKAVVVKPLRGKVFVSVPTGAARTSASVPGLKGRSFVPLNEARKISIGSLLDTRRGAVRLTSARDLLGRTQSGDFAAGVFQVLQSRRRKAKGLTELRLKGGSFARCPVSKPGKSSLAALRRRSIRRRLRSNAHGRFRASAKHTAGTVRGTAWTTVDRCDTTVTTVRRGVVAVRDFRVRTTVEVRRRERYVACAPGFRPNGSFGARSLSRRRIRRLRERDGRFRTCGRYSAATVRGG